MRSLRSRLLLLWALSLLAAVAVAAPLLALYRAQGRATEGRDDLVLARACAAIADRYAYYVTGWAGPPGGAADPSFRADLASVVDLALEEVPGGVEGGIWQQDAGILAPTGFDAATADAVGTVAAQAVQEEAPAVLRLASGGGALMLRACPLRGPVGALAAFALTRGDLAPGAMLARIGIGVLGLLVLALTIGVGVVLVGYTRRIGRIEAALGAAGPALPRLPATGERDLDRIVAAFNRTAEGLEAARAREAALAARVAAAERLAALGRVAAGVAHELRNPLAAMRLRAENALAGDTARRDAALAAILAQIGRLDRLAGELLDMTRPATPQPEPLALRAAIAATVPPDAPCAIEAPDATLMLDPALLHRALGNLVRNALRAAGPDGRVSIAARIAGETLAIRVADTGPGIPEALRDTLFEPFVTGHADGTGLGLAIAREAAVALGGSLVLSDPGGAGHGAVFTLELPAAWPGS